MAPWACSLSRHAPRTSEDVVKQPATGSAARRTAGAGQPELCRQVLDEAPAELDPTSRVAKAIAHNRGLRMGDESFAVQVFYSGLLISPPGWSATGSWHGQLSERCGILNTLDFSS